MPGKLSKYSQTSPQRPPWVQKKVDIVERWPLWAGRGVTPVHWNPVNTVINGPKTIGRNNEVAVLTRVSL